MEGNGYLFSTKPLYRAYGTFTNLTVLLLPICCP